jgi:hypothetical protein
MFLPIPNLPPFQGGLLLPRIFPGLKPWAESCCPFGTNRPGETGHAGATGNGADVPEFGAAGKAFAPDTPILHYSDTLIVLHSSMHDFCGLD